MNHLQPYQGGNSALWALHHLDIVRKHRRLLNARLRPIHMSIQGTLAEGDFTPLGGESAFNRLKDYRRIATRYDRLARNYLASVCLAAALVWWI